MAKYNSASSLSVLYVYLIWAFTYSFIYVSLVIFYFAKKKRAIEALLVLSKYFIELLPFIH